MVLLRVPFGFLSNLSFGVFCLPQMPLGTSIDVNLSLKLGPFFHEKTYRGN